MASDQALTLTFRDGNHTLAQFLADLTAALDALASGERVLVMLPQSDGKSLQEWRYATITLCNQLHVRFMGGKSTHYTIGKENGRHGCLYEAEYVIQK